MSPTVGKTKGMSEWLLVIKHLNLQCSFNYLSWKDYSHFIISRIGLEYIGCIHNQTKIMWISCFKLSLLIYELVDAAWWSEEG